MSALLFLLQPVFVLYKFNFELTGIGLLWNFINQFNDDRNSMNGKCYCGPQFKSVASIDALDVELAADPKEYHRGSYLDYARSTRPLGLYFNAIDKNSGEFDYGIQFSSHPASATISSSISTPSRNNFNFLF